MTDPRPVHRHRLAGCQPTPLASYLKALGVLRLVGGQRDPVATLWFEGEVANLATSLDRESLVRFFVDAYAPTPVLAPWNGGSGFFPKDNQALLQTIEHSTSPRWRHYRESISVARACLRELDMAQKPDDRQTKATLLQLCRGRFPEPALEWLDAALLLVQEHSSSPDLMFPPLLGTGGNDGRLDFSKNFMKCLSDLLPMAADEATPARTSQLAAAALFGEETMAVLSKAPIGQFSPSDAGGVNATSGFVANALINPWDVILMLEGAVMFAASAVRAPEKKGDGMGLAYPFTVRAVAAGYPSEGSKNTSRGEIWVPLWERPISAPEARALLSEGSARVGGRRAKTGLDFARAAASLGVDRGISAFQRYGFELRNGRSYFAIPLSRVPVHRDVRVELLEEVGAWLAKLESTTSETRAPASVKRVVRQLNAAVFALCEATEDQRAPRTLEVLVALGAVERQLARSSPWAATSFVAPTPPLSLHWLQQVDWSPEARLAAAAASTWAPHEARRRRPGSGPSGNNKRRALSFRESLETVELTRQGRSVRAAWVKDPSAKTEASWREGSLITALNRIVERRTRAWAEAGEENSPEGSPNQGGASGSRDCAALFAPLSDVVAFCAGDLNEQRLADLLWGFALIDWTLDEEKRALIGGVQAEWPDAVDRLASPPPGEDGDDRGGAERGPELNALYALLRLAFSPIPLRRVPHGQADLLVPPETRILRLGASGQGTRAAELAARRLRVTGIGLRTDGRSVRNTGADRATAALAFPIAPAAIHALTSTLSSRPSALSQPPGTHGPNNP